MPKTPITYREAFFCEVRGSGTPRAIKRMDFNSVETELGTMAEPVPMQHGVAGDYGKVANVDMSDAGFNKITVIQEEEFQARFFTGGNGGCFDPSI